MFAVISKFAYIYKIYFYANTNNYYNLFFDGHNTSKNILLLIKSVFKMCIKYLQINPEINLLIFQDFLFGHPL